MAQKIELFEESPMLGGYSLAVRDDWTYKIKRVHVSQSERDAYAEEFGEEIITYNRFFEWWSEFTQSKNS